MANAIFKDPRHFQIAFLSALLLYGWSKQIFEISMMQFAVVAGVACVSQSLCSFMIASRPDMRSALVTALSLSLLLRADGLTPLALAAAIAIGSKFILRTNDKHIFNPANIAIVIVVLLTDDVWVSPGQWGSAIWLAALIASLGMFVSYRAARLDIPIIFLSVLALLTFVRAAWLGDPLSIPMLRLQNGALILFAFFMISDPKTTPDGVWGRVIFASAIAVLTYILTYHFYMADGVFFALAAICAVRPVIEMIEPAPKYNWGDHSPSIAELIIPFHRPRGQLPVELIASKGEYK